MWSFVPGTFLSISYLLGSSTQTRVVLGYLSNALETSRDILYLCQKMCISVGCTTGGGMSGLQVGARVKYCYYNGKHDLGCACDTFLKGTFHCLCLE